MIDRDPETPVAPSIAGLVRQLFDDGNHLVRTEVRLAKAELRDNLAAGKTGAATIAFGGILLLGAVFTLLGSAVGFLTPYVGAGLAGLIVGVATAVIGGLLLVAGSKKVGSVSITPKRTIASLERDAQTVKGK